MQISHNRCDDHIQDVIILSENNNCSGGGEVQSCYEVLGAFDDLSSSDAIKCIALMEMSLSKSIDSEVKKLRKVIDCSDNVDKILCANKSINQTLLDAVHLEIVLYNKLCVLMQCKSGCCDVN